MTTTTQLYDYGTYTLKAGVRDDILDYINEFVDDYDLDGLTDAYRDAVNEQLSDVGITLIGDIFYSRVPVVEDSTDLIKQALADVDLGEIAPKFDKTA